MRRELSKISWYLSCVFALVLLAGCVSVKYRPFVIEQKTIPDVSVSVSYKADGIYFVQVSSDLPDVISLQWNSSAYVNTSGDTTRLIHISDVNNFPESTPLIQAPTLIDRRVKINSYFVGESWFDFSRRGVTPRPRDSDGKAKIYLSFEIKGKRVYWTGEVAFLPVK